LPEIDESETPGQRHLGEDVAGRPRRPEHALDVGSPLVVALGVHVVVQREICTREDTADQLVCFA